MAAITRGLIAGAAGTAVLYGVTYLDMAVRGRSASSAPADTADAALARLGVTLPGSGATLANRRDAAGALAGIGAGLAVGVGASLARAVGFRPGPAAGSALIGAAAMAATDVPMAGLGVSDPRTWTATDWVSDVVPHLVYGAAVHSTLVRLDHSAPRTRPRPGLLLRSALLGWAAGARASLGPGLPTLLGGGGAVVRAGAATGIVGELIGDKLPAAPSRLANGGAQSRAASGAIGATMLAGRAGARPFVPAAVGALGALAGAYGGFAWRAWAVDRMPAWQAAVAEDAVALGAAALACLPGRPAR